MIFFINTSFFKIYQRDENTNIVLFFIYYFPNILLETKNSFIYN